MRDGFLRCWMTYKDKVDVGHRLQSVFQQALHFQLGLSARATFNANSMKFKVFLLPLLLSAASAAPVAQDFFLIPSEAIPAAGYNSDFKLFENVFAQQQWQQQLANLFLPAEHRVEPFGVGQVKPLGSSSGSSQFAVYSAAVPVSGVPVAVNLQPSGQEGALIPVTGAFQSDSKEAPAAVKLAIAVPAVSQATRLTITIDIQPSSIDSQKNPAQGTPVVSATAPESISVDSAANPNSDAGITVEAAPIIEVASFPESLAAPVVDEDELSNRNPDGTNSPVAPGGIVQSGQPNIVSLVFQNSKDSPHLIGMLADAQAQFGTTRQ